jgi:serine/threonine-protein kinase
MSTGDLSPPADPTASAITGVSPEEIAARLRGATVGEYDILGELARGGMAAVYVAYDVALGRKVAIKVMSPALVFGEGMVERFKREARTAASLSHPNIIPVYAVREAGGLCFFVMKLIQGTTLDGVIREVGQAPIPMVEAVLSQAGSALAFAHRNGVVHRDVKPGNILIDDEGWLVVSDFGIAKVAEAPDLTRTGVAVGTPAYMSPEQCLGDKVTPATDQYALGVIAYEMLIGRHPFAGESAMAMMYGITNTQPAPIESRRPECPEPLRRTVMRMLAKDPADRWESLDDVVIAIGARSLSRDDPTRTTLVRLARTGSMAKLVARAQTPRSPVPITRSDRLAPIPASRSLERRSRPWLTATLALAAAAGLGTSAYLLLRTPSGPDSIAARPGLDSAGPAPAASQPPPVPPPLSPTAPSSRRTSARPETRPAVAERGPAPSRAGASDSAVPRDAGGARPAAPVPESTAVLNPAQITAAVRESAVVLRATPGAPPQVVPPPAALGVDSREEVEATIRRYGLALESGDLAQVRRAYPGITADQHRGLAAFYSAGGTLRTQWAIRDLVVSGQSATARIIGTNRVTTPRGRPADEPVDLRVRLERQVSGWRLVSVGE